jgi:hypothetical protein
MDEFNFGQPGRRTPQVSLNPKVLMVVGGLLVAALAVFVFLSFVSKSGHDVAESQVSAVQQVDLSQDRDAQSSLRNAAVAAKVLYIDASTYDGMTPADLASAEPGLTYTDGPSLDTMTVSVAVRAGRIGLAAFSPSGTCFYLVDDPMTGTLYGSGSTCTGAAALSSATDPSW